MDKEELLQTLQVKHRQLERYLFYFEKDPQGEFIASDRPKFSIQEMEQPGVVGEWSLRDLLVQIIAWERLFIGCIEQGVDSERSGLNISSLVAAGRHSVDELYLSELEAPFQLRDLSVEEVLDEFQNSFLRLMAVVNSISEAVLFSQGSDSRDRGTNLADALAFCTYEHYDWAKKLVRRWRRTHAGEYLNKKMILERIQLERNRLEKTLGQLSPSQMEAPGVIGAWSPKDVLAHLSDWEARFLGWYQAGLSGEVPEIPDPGLTWDDLGILNQNIYEKHRHRELEEVVSEFRRSYERVLATIREIPEKDIFEVGRYEWLGDGNLVGYILANTANHYRWAKTHIRDWLKSKPENHVIKNDAPGGCVTSINK
jgi:hypothetical protein